MRERASEERPEQVLRRRFDLRDPDPARLDRR